MKKILAVIACFFFFAGTASGLEIWRQRNIETRLVFPLKSSSGGFVSGEASGANADSEITSWDDDANPGALADCTNEIAEDGTSGIYYITLTASEMNPTGHDYLIYKLTTDNSLGQVLLIHLTEGDPTKLATTDDGGAINVTGGAIDTVASVTNGVTVSTNNDKAGYSLSASGIDSIWDEALAAHTTSDTPGSVLNMLTQDSVTLSSDVALDSIFGQLLDDGTSWSYDRTSDALEVAAASAADSVWDEALADHTTDGTFGGDFMDADNAATAADIADAVWDEATSGHTTAGTFGAQAATDIDAILADTNELQGNQNWDVWDDATRTLTALDEDDTTLDLDGTTVGGLTTWDKSGYSLSAAGVDAIWDEALAAHTTDDTPGDVLNMLTQDSVTLSSDVALGSVFGQLLDDGTSWSYDRSTDALEAIAAGSGGTCPSASAVADAVWDEAQSGHTTSGTFGYYLDAQVSGVGSGSCPSASDIWGYTTRTLTALDEDDTTVDLDGSTVGGVTNGVTVATNNDKAGYHLASSAITSTTFDPGAITADAIAAGAITSQKLADNAVTADVIADNAIDAAAIATGAITADKIASAAITASKFAANAISDAAFDAEATVTNSCNTALTQNGLDHLVHAAVTGTDVVDNSIIAKMVSHSTVADWDDYDNSTDSLEAIRNRGDSAWTTGTAEIADAIWDEALADHTTDGTFGGDFVDADTWTDTRAGYLDAAISSRSTLTTSDNIGVNLDDVTGTLDASEIGADAITAEKIAADAIGASELATDAVTEITGGVWTRTVENTDQTYTAEELLRAIAAFVAGEVSGGGTSTITFYKIGDTGQTEATLTMTVDANGNRSNVTIDVDR